MELLRENVVVLFYFYYHYSLFLWYLRVITECLCLLIHFKHSDDFLHSFITSGAHLMAIWLFLPSSFLVCKKT